MPKCLYPSTYPQRVLTMKCGSDLLERGLFPRKTLFKELSESYAAVEATFNHLPHLLRKDPNVAVVVIGDGTTPRTAALFAYLTRWTAYSTDPRMTQQWWGHRIVTQRLQHEDAEYHIGDATKVLVVAVHSHGPLALRANQVWACSSVQRIDVVAVPCCVPQQWDFHEPPDVVYDDPCIWSPHNTVRVYRDCAWTP